MKSILLLLALSLTACASTQYRSEWVVDTQDKAKYDQFMVAYNECKDFAYRSRVAGSRFAEGDIHTSCLQRKGYSFKVTEVK